jgi:hypothetical protein
LTSEVITVVLIRIQDLQIVNIVTAWMVPNILKEKLTSKTPGTTHTVAHNHIPEDSNSPVVNTLGYVSTEVVSRAQEGPTMAQFSDYNVRVLEHFTTMCPPAISDFYCQHH